jgi:DNA-binding CsgD family transcriptional regulator/PAS domain-containing protein
MSDAVTLAQQSSLIGSIYDCALDPDLWPSTLRRLCEVFGGHSAGIVLLDFKGVGDRLVRDWGPTTTWADKMGGVLDSVKRIHRQFLGMSGARVDEPILLPRDLAPQVEVFNTPFYKEWAAPQRIHQVMEAVALSETTRLGLFCITRQDHMGYFTDAQIDLLRELAPHIRRAITISDLLDLKTVERQAFAAVIDSIPTGICIVGSGGQILHSNRAAKAMLERRTPIRSEDGRLRGVDSTATAELLSSIGTAQQDEAQIGANGIGVPLRVPDGPPSIAHVLPLSHGDIRTRLMPQALAAVFINADGPASFANLDAIARSFEFTPAETRLANELLLGRTVAEAASALGVGESTAKTHLQNVFLKAGVSRQVDLLILLHRLIPTARRPG